MKGKPDYIEINQFITSSTRLRPHNLTNTCICEERTPIEREREKTHTCGEGETE